MKVHLFLIAALFAAMPALAQSRVAANAFPQPVPRYLAEIINDAARTHGVDANLIAAMAYKESRFNTNAVSRLGAQGIMQLKPKTARSLGVLDSFDARQNIFGATKYLRKLLDRFGGDVDLALAGYNAGPERVAKEGPNATKEATEYVAMVKAYYASASRQR
ncbi:MAG TPA: transglycosylase SLT domain-containing protein [Thermoanaerobaculia bacterium]|nr:transglycosylase SLT domain-containing protein [Thermoanaerobaculia bacterium]